MAHVDAELIGLGCLERFNVWCWRWEVTLFNRIVVSLYKGSAQPEVHDEGSPTGESFI
ncbi:MAG: hypothetical protein PVF58_22445 [Candidatus Methanofastidiosia archaeon]